MNKNSLKSNTQQQTQVLDHSITSHMKTLPQTTVNRLMHTQAPRWLWSTIADTARLTLMSHFTFVNPLTFIIIQIQNTFCKNACIYVRTQLKCMSLLADEEQSKYQLVFTYIEWAKSLRQKSKTQVWSKTQLKTELDLATKTGSKNILRPNFGLRLLS